MTVKCTQLRYKCTGGDHTIWKLSVRPHIKGSYYLREDGPSDNSMSRTYHDLQIIYLQMHTKETHFS